jgi:DedD protein
LAEESTVPEDSGDIRRKAFVRLGIAAVVTALALGGLWWLDNSGKTEPKPKPAAPSPIVAAPTQPPPEEPKPVETPQPTPAPEIPEPQPPEEAAAPTTPPPPPAIHPAQMSHAVHTPAQTPHQSSRQTAPALQIQPVAPIAKPAPANPAPVQTVSNGRYAVQVGVFSNPAHAQELVDQLNKQGIHAYVETRVHVGPFTNRAEAEKAQAALKKLGITGLIGPSAAMK